MNESGRHPMFRGEDFWRSPRRDVLVFTEPVAIDEVSSRFIGAPFAAGGVTMANLDGVPVRSSPSIFADAVHIRD
jgi:hypothetical protein